MDGVFDEGCKVLGAHVFLLVVGDVRLLLQHVVKSGGPLPAAQPGCVAAVVDHECYPPSVHVGVQRVHSLQKSSSAQATQYWQLWADADLTGGLYCCAPACRSLSTLCFVWSLTGNGMKQDKPCLLALVSTVISGAMLIICYRVMYLYDGFIADF